LTLGENKKRLSEPKKEDGSRAGGKERELGKKESESAGV
jgi:hypothetical protein